MRIFYDGFIYDFQQYGGINRYFNEIIARLPGDTTPVVSTFLGPRPFWPEHPNREIVRSRPFAKAPALAPLGRCWMDWRSSRSHADLFHPTYYQLLSPRGLGRRRKPLVVTVHDMIHEIFAAHIDPDGELSKAKRACIEKADAVLCNSEHTRADLLERYPQMVAKTFVTPLASSMSVDPALERTTPPPERPYFLYVGGRETYKNFGLLLNAWRNFSPRHPDVQLRVVGSPWRPEEQSQITDLGLRTSIIHQGKVADHDLPLLYRQSIALVYPSLYEGFGIPPLEAMRCGTAVICSNASSLPEVGGDAPLYFDPNDSDALLAQMEALSGSSSLRETCVSAGERRARTFTWDRTAALTLEIYRQLAPAA